MNELRGEKCGVFGVYGKGLDVARSTYFGLYALQHRGQESSGIAVADGKKITCYKHMGLVAQVFSEDVIAGLSGYLAIGHNRYSTAGGSKLEHAQPLIAEDESFALAHNGNVPSTVALEEYLRAHTIDPSSFSDSRMIVEAIATAHKNTRDIEEAIREVYPLMTGAFSILIATKDKIIAIRDQCGIRPLSIAQLGEGWVVSSETCAMHTVGATFMRDVTPGEMVVIDGKGLRALQLAPANQKLDVFEFVYFARPDSELLGRSVYEVRRGFGARLAREYRIEADVIIPVPETAIPVAIGYSRESNIPLEMGLMKNRYIHRTFIQPEQRLREESVRLKLTPIPKIIRGKRVIVIDDSIVRGTTSKQIVKMLFGAGAREVHFVVSSPPVKFPDFYGIDTPKQGNLLAASKTVPEMQRFLGATTLQFLSYQGLVDSVGVPELHLNTSCFTGIYPIDLKERVKEVRYAKGV